MKSFGDTPPTIAALPRDEHGYPVPFFVASVDGKPDLRFADAHKAVECCANDLCWICGTKLSGIYCFIGGPNSCANRKFSDFASHRDCAAFAVKHCPHLNNSKAQRREANKPANTIVPAGALLENCGRVAIYVATEYRVRRFGQLLFFNPGPALQIIWHRDGVRIKAKRGSVT